MKKWAFWITICVVSILNGVFFFGASASEMNQTIRLLDTFQLSGLSKKVKVFKIAFLITTCLLMILGYSLFAKEVIWAICYALSGGVLLLLLYTWKKTSVQRGRFAD